MKLYTYWRSTASYRVRIALALKGVSVEAVPVHLVRDGGEQNAPWYRKINPQGRVPALELDDGTVIGQSAAIIEYIDEACAGPALIGTDPVSRALARQIAGIIGSDTHPLHNVGPLNYLKGPLSLGEPEVSAWISEWMGRGLSAVEALIGDSGYCLGNQPGLADIYLVPQVYAARRFAVNLDNFPRIGRVAELAASHSAFISSHPDVQADAPAPTP